MSHAKDANDESLKDMQPAEKYTELVKKEAVRLGVTYHITGKYTSCVAVESNTAAEEGQHLTERDITITPRSDPPNPPRYEATSGGGYVLRQCASQPAAQNSPMPPPPSGHSSTPHRFQFLAAPAPANPTKQQESAAFFSPPAGGEEAPAHFRKAPSPTAPYDSTLGGDIDYELDSTEEEEEDDSDNKNDFRPDPLHLLIALQTFAGFWEYSETLLFACSVSVTEEMIPKGADSQIFATLLAVYFLETKMADEREVWELVVEKARGWLEGRGGDIAGEGDEKGLKEMARRLIEEAG